MKRCSRCDEAKPLAEFHKRARSKDGRVAACITCTREWSRAWRENNAEKVAAWRRSWKAENREHIAEVERARYEANREAIRAAHREWYQANKESRRESQRAWHAKNPSRASAIRARRRALRFGGEVHEVDLESIWDGLCALCGDAIDSDAAWPHPLSKSVDHIIPLAMGGTHPQDNVQWAHLRCNLSKGARMSTQSREVVDGGH